MADYLNFTKILPPNPNDPNVDLVNQINVNWDMIDTKLQPYISGGSLTLAEQGQEYFDVNFRYAVWNGSAPRLPDDIDGAWSAWTALPLSTNFVARSGFTPRWRNNSLLRMVELSGGVQYQAGAATWPAGLNSVFDGLSNPAGAIPLSMVPIGGYTLAPCAAALSAGSVVVASGLVRIDIPTLGQSLRVQAQYMGGPGGGNFLQFDQVWWWY